MFKKALIIERYENISVAISIALQELSIKEIYKVSYFDEAFLKIKKDSINNAPFDLVIMELATLEDNRFKYKIGEDFIIALREIHSNIKVIVFSIEDRTNRIRLLFDKYDITGYVLKNRSSLKYLKEAINCAEYGKKFVSPELENIFYEKSIGDIQDFDIEILKCLSEGFKNEEISAKLKAKDITPNSVSYIEKRINRLKIYFNAINTVHLISIAKDMSII